MPVLGCFPSRASQQKAIFRPTLVASIWWYQSCKSKTKWLRLEQKNCRKAGRILSEYCTTRVYPLPSKQSSSTTITTTLYLGFDKAWELIARKYYWLSLQKNVGSLCQKMLRLFDLGISPTRIFSRSLYQIIGGNPSQGTFWPGYPFQLTRKAIATNHGLVMRL